MTSGAMQGLATGRREGKPAKREQTVLTPQPVVDVLVGVWGGVILDPCHAPGSLVCADETYDLAQGQDGLALPWYPGTYFNPPYDQLKAWLAKAAQEPEEQIGLFPVRPHRPWWLEYCEVRQVGWLKPLKFVGYDQPCPLPLVLVYTGQHGRKFREAVQDLKLGTFQTMNGERT